MARRNRAVRRRQGESGPIETSPIESGPIESGPIESGRFQPGGRSGRSIHVHVTVALPRHLGWLLAGVACGGLRLPGRLLEQAYAVLRVLLSG